MSDSPPQHDRMSSGCEAGSRFTAAAGPAQPIALDARAFVAGLKKVDLTTGHRQPVGELGPANPTGAPLVLLIQISRDGRRYAYTTGEKRGTVFVIDGVKW